MAKDWGELGSVFVGSQSFCFYNPETKTVFRMIENRASTVTLRETGEG